jgi:hypothetical protein
MSDQKLIDQMTPDEMRREIATRLGYTLYLSANGDWCLVYPNGKIKNTWLSAQHELDEVFPICCEFEWIPNWPTDLNAAARDLLAIMPGWTLYYTGGYPFHWRVRGNPDDYELPEDIPCFNNEDPATAICLAWLQMERDKEASHDTD